MSPRRWPRRRPRPRPRCSGPAQAICRRRPSRSGARAQPARRGARTATSPGTSSARETAIASRTQGPADGRRSPDRGASAVARIDHRSQEERRSPASSRPAGGAGDRAAVRPRRPCLRDGCSRPHSGRRACAAGRGVAECRRGAGGGRAHPSARGDLDRGIMRFVRRATFQRCSVLLAVRTAVARAAGCRRLISRTVRSRSPGSVDRSGVGRSSACRRTRSGFPPVAGRWCPG